MPQHFNMLFWRSTTTIALIVLVAIDYTKNYSVAAAFSQGTGAPNAERVLTINNRKEHVYSYSSMLKDTRTNADSEGAVVFEVDTENEMISDRRRKKWISASVSLDMPFPAEIAFDTFSDLTRQPQWSPWLRSVIYLDEVKEVVQMNKNEYRIDSPSMPLRETKWTLGIKGFDFSWRAVSTLIDRPHRYAVCSNHCIMISIFTRLTTLLHYYNMAISNLILFVAGLGGNQHPVLTMKEWLNLIVNQLQHLMIIRMMEKLDAL